MNTNEKEVTPKEFIENQRVMCKETNTPFFMPEGGRCWSCKRDIVPKLISDGLDGKTPVTGCPFCFRSYCD